LGHKEAEWQNRKPNVPRRKAASKNFPEKSFSREEKPGENGVKRRKDSAYRDAKRREPCWKIAVGKSLSRDTYFGFGKKCRPQDRTRPSSVAIARPKRPTP